MLVAFTNKGARVLSWRLKEFRDDRGRPEEMVLTAPGAPLPLDIETGDAALDARLREALFRPSVEALQVRGGQEGSVTFEYADGEVEARKTLRVQPQGYLVAVGARVRQRGHDVPVTLLWGPGVGNPTPEEMEVQGYIAPQGVALTRGGVETLPAEKLETSWPVPEARWVGVAGTYFAALFVPAEGSGAGEVRRVSLPPAEDGEPRTAVAAALRLEPGALDSLLFVGPKDYQLLSSLGHELARVVPVGDWIGPIVVLLMRLLRFVQGHVGNYGWSIVALTVLINLIMAPLRHYSIANGVKMAKLAPEMRVIQERYRKVPALDPRRQEMQTELAALYARHGMSMSTQMMVGCLPLLLTMPFLIAFYRVLQVSIELRGAGFLWIADLSRKDPYFVTPLLMGGSMLLMQKMTPSSMDPAQQRIMMIMPVVLVGMFLWAPAGLNLYWLASNVCAIAQQGVTLQLIRRREAAAAGPKDRKERKAR
jgi:YidC/Oxa1 family membrane protein insertase